MPAPRLQVMRPGWDPSPDFRPCLRFGTKTQIKLNRTVLTLCQFQGSRSDVTTAVLKEAEKGIVYASHAYLAI